MRYSHRSITVKYAGKCCTCGGTIHPGETADYYPAKREIAHSGGIRGKCFSVLNAKANDPGFVDLDRAYEDSCADICGR